MPDLETILSSPDFYKQAFEQGLVNIIKNQTAGTFILACANIFQQPELLKKNKMLLRDCYKQIKNDYKIRKQQPPTDADDDVMVMNQIISVGFDNLQPLKTRQPEKNGHQYQLNLNQLRSFRPARMSAQKNIRLNTAFNPNGFHFDKAFLKKEIFAEGAYQGKQISLLYNKFPFVNYHALLVVDKNLQHNQFLTKEYLDYIFCLQTDNEIKIPEWVTAYNSLGAGASINHLHFQVFLQSQPLALFSSHLTHNGGTESWPAYCCVFNTTEACWHYLQQLHAHNIPYNLLVKYKKIFCLPRKPATQTYATFNVASYGWSEMAGIFTFSDNNIFTQATPALLEETLRSVSSDTIPCKMN